MGTVRLMYEFFSYLYHLEENCLFLYLLEDRFHFLLYKTVSLVLLKLLLVLPSNIIRKLSLKGELLLSYNYATHKLNKPCFVSTVLKRHNTSYLVDGNHLSTELLLFFYPFISFKKMPLP